MEWIVMFFLGWGTLQGNTVSATPESSQQAARYDQGRKIFASRCAKCHDEDASKKLPDGSTLPARLAKSNDRRRLLGTRLKDVQERDAVMDYLEKLLDRSIRQATRP